MTLPLPRTMSAMLLTGHGGLDRLQHAEVDVPHPAAGEVLVRLGGAALNNTDVNLRIGWYSRSSDDPAADAGWGGAPVAFPRIQGADGAGCIVAVGEGVAAGRIGERVIIDPVLRTGAGPLYFGSDIAGAFAQYTTVPEANAVAIRSALSDPELASFPCSYLAALHMATRAGVRAGQRVLVTGASGGVGTAALQWCRVLGAQVVAVAEAGKHDALRTLGVSATLTREASLTDALGADSIDVVLDVVGGGTFAGCLQVLRPRGHYATAGAIGGPIVGLDLRTLYLKDLTLHGCTIPPPALFAKLVAAIESGALRPLIAARWPLQRLADAQEAFLRKAHLGKIVLDI